MKPKAEWDRCQWNDGVMCPEKKCESCGWFPKVIKARKEQLKYRNHVTVLKEKDDA